MDLNFFKNKKVLIAVSTGVDSMVLLEMMRKIDCIIFVVYVRHHHRVRVHIENEFFTKYCDDENINLTTYDYYHESGNFEMVAREYRYQCFKEVYDQNSCDYLLTAHHGDDLVETMLMRTLRGTDINGIGGIRGISFRYGMNVARPLLSYSKQDLRIYAKENNIKYYEDETNADTSYQRNFLRHEVIPKFPSGYIDKFLNLSEEFYELADYINDVVSEHIEVYTDVFFYPRNLDKRLYKYGIKKSLAYLYKSDIPLITDKHIKLILNLKDSNKLELPKEYYVYYKKGYYVFSKNETEIYNYNYDENLEFSFLNSKISFGGGISLRLSDEVVLPLKVTNAKMDMEIKLKNGTQKLNRVFINAKVPMHKRRNWPILIDAENKVLCVFALKYSKYCLNDTMNYKYMLQYNCNFKGDDFDG